MNPTGQSESRFQEIVSRLRYGLGLNSMEKTELIKILRKQKMRIAYFKSHDPTRNPLFDTENALSELSERATQIPELNTQWYFPAVAELNKSGRGPRSDGVSSEEKYRRLTDEEETILFLQFNFARNRIRKSLEAAPDGPRPDEDSKELAQWIERAQKLRECIVNWNLPLVLQVLKKEIWNFRGEDIEDLLSMGNQGLLNAIDTFDPKLNNRFSTPAWLAIKHAMLRVVEKKILPTVPLDEPDEKRDSLDEYGVRFSSYKKLQQKVFDHWMVDKASDPTAQITLELELQKEVALSRELIPVEAELTDRSLGLSLMRYRVWLTVNKGRSLRSDGPSKQSSQRVEDMTSQSGLLANPIAIEHERDTLMSSEIPSEWRLWWARRLVWARYAEVSAAPPPNAS